MKEDLLKKFRIKYSGHLKQSSKFNKNERPIQICHLVLVSSDNIKKIESSFAKVIEFCLAKDTYVRLVKIKIQGGEFLSPVLRLILLEVIDDSCTELPNPSRISESNVL